jgi:hypothetical protein
MRLKLAIATASLLLSNAATFAADPLATVRALSEALQNGKSADALALIDTNGGYAYSLDGALATGDRFRGWLQSDIVGPGSKFRIEGQTVTGGTVDTQVMWGRGEMNRPARYIFEIRDGKIVSWRMTNR